MIIREVTAAVNKHHKGLNGVKLIVGLGNPGKKYKKNRHNVGFRIVDALASELNVEFAPNKKFNAEIGKITSSHSPLHKGEKVGVTLLAKPQTFMNNSGQALAALKKFYKLENSDILVIHDEIDLPFGKIKKYSGSGSAGHNGINSAIDNIGSGFLRLRIGIENREKFRVPETEDYVLQNFTPEEKKRLKKEIVPAAILEIQKNL